MVLKAESIYVYLLVVLYFGEISLYLAISWFILSLYHKGNFQLSLPWEHITIETSRLLATCF